MRTVPDPRFFESLGPVELSDLADATGARIDPAFAGVSLTAASVLGVADRDSVSFFADRRYANLVGATRARACFVREADAALLPGDCIPLVTPRPHGAWSMIAGRLHKPHRLDAAAPEVHPGASLEPGVVLGQGAIIGDRAEIGAGTVIGAHAVIGPGVAIGRDCEIGPNAVIGCALIGDRVKIYAGAVIGEAGFGLSDGPMGPVDVPQLGRVILQDSVTVGANSCIDRGAYEDTVIGEATKIDNLSQIAHNAQIGRGCILVAFTGISGSTVLGDGVTFGARAGVGDHLTVGAGARIGAGAGVLRNVPAGEDWGGLPARPVREYLREIAWVARAVKRKGRGGEGA